jgi:2'-5' RNA ligase
MTTLADLPPRIRGFVAIDANAGVARAVDELIGQLRTAHDAISWVRGANLHLTLRFLGDAIDSARLPALASQLGGVAAGFAPFVVRLHGTGAFPSLDRPRVLWVGLESPELIALAAQVEAAALAAGFDAERRPYAPHLTIGRVREPHRFRKLRPGFERSATRDFGAIEAGAMTLYRSVLAPDGAQHQALATFALRGRHGG